MGSVIDHIECPNCEHEAYSDFYYKTGEEYVNCQNCGYHYSATFKTDDEGEYITKDGTDNYALDNMTLEIKELKNPYGAYRVRYANSVGYHCGSLENENDYTEPLKRLSKENKYLEKYIPKNKNELNDTVIQFYIKSMKNISILCVYPNSVTMNDQYEILIKRLKEFGTIHYTKDISINYYTAYNLIYQLYANEERMKSNAHILYKINRLGFKKDSVNKMQVIVYSLSEKSKKENINISGSSAAFKMELRDIFVNEAIKNTKFTEDDDRYPRGYDFLHISDNSNQSYEYASLFFHENSMNFLEKQKSWRLLDMSKAQENFNKLKEFIYDYSMMELEKLLLNSSVTLYTHGIREANDIDGILLGGCLESMRDNIGKEY
jgi:Zn ribbon nucleic-acid-binding protein